MMSVWIVLRINNSRYQCWQVSVIIWSIVLSISYVSLKSDNITYVEMSYVLAQSTYLDIINSTKSREITVFFKYEIECDSKRKMAPLLNHNHYHPLGKKEKSFLSMFCVCYHTKTSSIMSANLRVGISIRPLALYTKVILPGLAK